MRKIIAALLVLLSTTGCGKETDTMDQEKQAVLQVFEAMQQAMIDKDLDTMRRITAEDKTFTHMSGKTQTREEFFAEIRNGTLNYYNYEIRNLQITVNDDTAHLSADVTLTAKVYYCCSSGAVRLCRQRGNSCTGANGRHTENCRTGTDTKTG